MENNYFDQIAQEIVQQKHYMDKLEEENQELRQQIVDLKIGHSIVISGRGHTR